MYYVLKVHCTMKEFYNFHQGDIPGPTYGKGQLLTSSEFVCEPETLEVRDTFQSYVLSINCIIFECTCVCVY